MIHYQIRFKKAIDFLKEQRGFTYADIASKLSNFKLKYAQNAKNVALSAPQISRYYTGEKDVTRPTIEFLERYLNTLRIVWDEETQNYQMQEGELDINSSPILNPFKNLKGVYQMYHLSQCGNTILRNILRIDYKGKVIIEGYSNCKHHGEVTVFKEGLVSIQIHTLEHAEAEEEKFYYHILANLAAYVQNGQLFHFVGISTTIPLSYEPTASKRVFIKLSSDEQLQGEDLTHRLFFVNKKEDMDELNALSAGKVADFLLRNSTLISKEKANEPLS